MSSFSHDLHISGLDHHALQYAQYYQCCDDSHINAHNENNKRFSRSDFFLDWMDLHHNIYLWQRNITFLLLFWIFICWIGQGKSNNITKVFTHLYLVLKCILLLCTNLNFSKPPSYHQKYLFYGKFCHSPNNSKKCRMYNVSIMNNEVNRKLFDTRQVPPMSMMILILVASIPFVNWVNNLLKRRNLPTLLSCFFLLKLIQIVLTENLYFAKNLNTGDEASTFKLDSVNQSLALRRGEAAMSQIMIMYKNHNQTRALNIDGAEQIFLSIIQSPSFIIHDNSAVTVVLVSGAMLLFSPYMYIFSLEGATVAYFTSVLAGLDTDALSRQQHCVTGNHVTSLCIILIQNYYLTHYIGHVLVWSLLHCVLGMMINCILSVYLVPSPGSHIAGKVWRLQTLLMEYLDHANWRVHCCRIAGVFLLGDHPAAPRCSGLEPPPPGPDRPAPAGGQPGQPGTAGLQGHPLQGGAGPGAVTSLYYTTQY